MRLHSRALLIPLTLQLMACAAVGCTPSPHGNQPLGVGTIKDPGTLGEHSLAVDPDLHMLYILNANDHSVSVTDTRTTSPGPTIQLDPGEEYGGIVVDPIKHELIVNAVYYVQVIDEVSRQLTMTVNSPTTDGIRLMALDPVAGRLYVTSNDVVSILNVATGGIDGSVPMGMAQHIAVDTSSHRVFVSTSDPGGVVNVIQPDGGVTFLRPHGGGSPGVSALATDPSLDRVYIGQGSSIDAVDERTGHVVHSFHTGCPAGNMAVNPHTHAVWATGLGCSLLDKTNHFEVLDGLTYHTSLTLSGITEGSVIVDISTGVAYIETNGGMPFRQYVQAYAAPRGP